MLHCDDATVTRNGEIPMALPAVDSIRSEVRSLQPYVPGKPIEELERELGIAGAIKLASNENPLGPSPLALHAIEETARYANRYPDGSSYYLREALSAHWGVPSESIAVGYYRAQQYAKSMQWSQRYFKEGGTSGAIRTMLIQSQYLSGDFAGASRELMAEITAAERAGQAPQEDRLKLLLNAATKQNDNNAYVFAVEKLVTYYPKKEYWVDLLSRMQRKPTFSDRLSLDAYRLSLATGSMSKPADFMEMAQLALQADLPGESKQVVDKGFAANVLGTGPEAERHKRLKALIDKDLA